MAKEWNTSGYVYLIRSSNGLYKIGCSNNVVKRMGVLRTMSPVELTLVHSIEYDEMYSLEEALHYKFSNNRHHGEWFSLSESQVRWIKSLDKENLRISRFYKGNQMVIKIEIFNASGDEKT